MRRREALRNRAEAEVQEIAPPVAAPYLQEAYTPVGYCPRCGVRIGRAIRAHTLTCDGKSKS